MLMSGIRDVDSFHLEKQTHLKFGTVSIGERGPLRATLAASINLGQSRLEVDVRALTFTKRNTAECRRNADLVGCDCGFVASIEYGESC